MASYSNQDVILSNVTKWVNENVHTTIVAKVTDVSSLSERQLLTATPVTKRVDFDGVTIELPSIVCPVLFPSGGGGIMTFPIEVGDFVEVRFNMFSLQEWLVGAATPTTPKDKRRYSYVDAIATPCLYTTTNNLNPNPTDVEIKFQDMSVKLEKTGDVSVSNSNGNFKLKADGNIDFNPASLVTINGNLTVTGDTTLSSTVTSNGKDISDTHTHSGVQTGGGNTGVPN